MKLIHTLIFCVACVLPVCATAQWQWVDKDGRKVFSDTPPPSDTPESKILRRPGQRGPSGALPPAAPVEAATAAAKPGGADKELLDKKKQLDKQNAEADAAKRKAEEEKLASIRADNCTRARQSKAGLDSGVRQARTNDKGEREFYDEKMIADENQRLQGIINENCK
jgi:hypothetical protein